MTAQLALFLTVVILLPLVPAFLLYRLLPVNKSDVEGPWHGLQIKLGGAFGAYFLLVVTLLFYTSMMPRYDVWTVRGTVALEDASEPVEEGLVRFTLRPRGDFVDPNGGFGMTLFSVPAPGGQPQLPTLIISYPNYMPTGIDLERVGSKSGLNRHVHLTEPVVLRRVPERRLEVEP